MRNGTAGSTRCQPFLFWARLNGLIRWIVLSSRSLNRADLLARALSLVSGCRNVRHVSAFENGRKLRGAIWRWLERLS
jgi:hypothetical protein